MRFEIIDDGSGFDAAMTALDEEAELQREAAIAGAVAKSVAENEGRS